MDFVVVESPFATSTVVLADGLEYVVDRAENILYARACLHDCLVNHGEAPFASHLLYTQPGVLDDDDPAQRKLGIEAGFELGWHAVRRVFYVDRGVTRGMRKGFDYAVEHCQACEIRTLGGVWDIGWVGDRDLDDHATFLRG
jgi:hypothetical protein